MKKRSIPVLLGVVFSAVVLTGCYQKGKLREIHFEDVVQADAAAEEGKYAELNVCVGSMITPREGYAYYKALLDYVGEKLGMKVNFIERESYAEVNALLEAGKIDVAFVCGGPYVDGKEKFGLELLAAPRVDGKTVYHSYVIARKNASINMFDDLKGKTFVFVDPLSNTGKIYPDYVLKQAGATPDTYFKEYVYSYAHDTSIRAVAEGFVDAGAVDSLIWNYLDRNGSPYTKQLKIIKVSPPYGIPPVVVRPALDAELKGRIKNVLLSMHSDSRGREILDSMFIDRFAVIDDSDYDSIREMKKDLNRQ